MSRFNYLNKLFIILPSPLDDELLDFFVDFLLLEDPPNNPPRSPPTSTPAASATLAPLTVLDILPKISSISLLPPPSDVNELKISVKLPELSLIVLLTVFFVSFETSSPLIIFLI